MYRLVFKRVVDVVVSLIALLALGPLMLLVTILVRVKLGSPILFRQIRPGLGGKPFKIFKFRSMSDARLPDGAVKSDMERLTKFGKLLRSTSLDELPALLNVLRGDMSLVGPRPLLMQYLVRYTPQQFRRHEVRPGITGWAQINGRNSVRWEQRLELDVWYVQNHSFWLDIKILVLTVVKVFKRDGISADGEATMVEFKGTQISDEE